MHNDLHNTSLLALQQIGCLVGRDVFHRVVVDLDDPVAGLNSRLVRGAATDDVGNQQRTIGRLQLDSESDKVAFDLRIDIVELLRREERRVLIEAVGGSANIFKNAADGGNAKLGFADLCQ